MRLSMLFVSLSAVALAACAQEYTSPEASGLVAVRPYPAQADVCQVIGENAATNKYLDDSRLLIGCPNHETGAIENRLNEGGKKVGKQGDWTLISMPLR